MEDGARREQWTHTANVLAQLHNTSIHQTGKSDIREAADYNPYLNGALEEASEDDEWERNFDPDDDSTWMKHGGIDADDIALALAHWE